jgi:Ca2+-binding EF-hand superfamily protein
MANEETFTISRAELRRILTNFGVTEKNLTALFNSMEKAHRHINIIAFVSMLEKAGMDRDETGNIFRRLNMDDVTIKRAFDMVDEEKINSETGRLYDASVDIS